MKEYKSKVKTDEFTNYASKAFDYEFDGNSEFIGYDKPHLPEDFSIGVIHGASGSGKSTLLSEYGEEREHIWDIEKAVVSHFKTPEEATEKLTAVGLNSIPTWMKPFSVLSTGEKFRANLARSLENGAVIDEFTSVVNRSVAKSASVAVARYVKKNKLKNIVIATCHNDILEWLCPEWDFNTDSGELSVRGYLQRPPIRLEIFRANHKLWDAFKNYHYLSADLNKCCTCFRCVWDGVTVGFSASIPLPSKIPPLYAGDVRKKYRESRTVILPDYQGLGIGVRFSDAVADIWLENGYRFFSKTAHIRMGQYREHSKLWRATSTNLKSREKSQKRSKSEVWHHMALDTKRLCYSHEYIGEAKKDTQ